MLKKVSVAVIAAGALSVPLAGVAGADPGPTNPGLPGNVGRAYNVPSTPPGGQIHEIAQQDPGSTASAFKDQDGVNESPGNFINDFAPGQSK
jgi:hypothetical protein